MDTNTKEKLLERLEAKTVRWEQCWIYKGTVDPSGHCRLKFNGKTYTVSRLSAYLHWNFDLNSPMQILHSVLCIHANCWNPAHLREGTPKDNAQDSIMTGTFRNVAADANREKTHCPRGHEYSEENTYVTSKGQRYCKTCNREKAREYYRKTRGHHV